MATYYPPSSEQMYAHNGGMGGGPPPYHIPPHYHPHPAPRQRTAIACRYCRRRKIRCSGFETSPDGRCANCLRFNQECVFTPVSSQTQAFIPAHAVGRQGILYGPQGQPLPANYAVQNQNQGIEYAPAPAPSAHAAHPPHRLPSPPGSQNEPRYMYQEDPNRRPIEGGLPPPLVQPRPSAANPAAPPPFARRTSGSEYNHYGNPPTSPSSHLPSPRHHAYSPPPVNGPSSFGQGPPPLQAAPGSYGSAPLSINTQRQPDSPSASSFHSGDHPSVSPQPQPFHPPMVYPPRPTSTGPNGGHSIPSMQIADLIDSPGPSQGPQPPNAHQRAAADGAMLDKLMPRKGL